MRKRSSIKDHRNYYIMKKKKSQSEKLLEFFLSEHEESVKRGIFNVEYGYKFSFLEIPKGENKNVRTNIKDTPKNTENT